MVFGEEKSFKQESSKSKKVISLDIFPKTHYDFRREKSSKLASSIFKSTISSAIFPNAL